MSSVLSALVTVVAVLAEPAPVPDDAAVEKATETLRGLYKAELAKKSPADLQALAVKLFQLGLNTRGNPADRFVLFREAADLAARGADPDLAVKAVEQLAAEFQVDQLKLEADALERSKPAASDARAHRAIMAAALLVADQAVRADRYDEAVRCIALATAEAPRAKDEDLGRRATAREREIREIAAESKEYRKMMARLKEDPKDADAARAVGRFRCLLKGDWAGGLQLLAESGDGKLAALARKDFDSPGSADEQHALASAYWELAAGESDAVALRHRAAHWYRRSLPGLSGLTRDRAVRRIEDADPNDPWGRLDLTNGTVVDDFVRVRLESQIATFAAVSGPIEIRVVARTTGNNIRLYGPRGSCVIFNWEVNPKELRVHRPDATAEKVEGGSIATAPVRPLAPDTWYLLRWRLTPTQIDILIDDKVIFSEKGKYNLSTKSQIRVGAVDHPVEVRAFTVKPIK